MKTVKLAAIPLVLALCLTVGFALFPSVARADTIIPVSFGFDDTCEDGSIDTGFPSQITGYIRDIGGGQVEIIFSNGFGLLSPTPSSITQIDFAGLDSLFNLTISPNPPVFPSFNEYNDELAGLDDMDMLWNDGHHANIKPCGYVQSAYVGADEPPPHRGIQVTEALGIEFNLLAGKTAKDVVDACSAGDLRFALHVQAISPNGDSIKLYNLTCLTVNPTYISLASSNIKEVDGGIEVSWETGVEIDTAGFNLYRAPSFGGPYVKVNDQLVGANGNGAGAAYSVVDSNGSVSDVYRLEDIDYNGVSTLHYLNRSDVAQDNSVRLFMPMLAQE